MPAIFLSHSSRNDALASALEAWLAANGFDDLFVDHSDIRAGDKWGDALRRAKGSCRVVLCLVTPEWLASDECFGEFTAGWYSGRRIIPLLCLAGATLDDRQTKHLARVLGEDQGVDLTAAGAPGALDLDAHPGISGPLKAGLRAAGALAKVGLDPMAFEIDRAERAEPFPGLESFGDSDADAAVFFGRSPEIAQCLEDLREMRANGDRRAYAILGASGSGKSSLMKAGVLPRLRRERGWFVLRSFRPGADPLLNFAEALVKSGVDRAPGAIRDQLRSAWKDSKDLRAELDLLLAPVKTHADRASATTLIAMDQGEELARADGESGDCLGALLRAMLVETKEGDPRPYVVAFTVRSDSFPELQAAKRFEDLTTRTADIRTLPSYRFDNAIEQPATRYGVDIEPALVEALMSDAGGKDALPLLAFTLQRLWRQYEKEKRIRKENYDSVGKLSGLIEDAAERALRGLDPSAHQGPLDGKVSDARDRAAASVFVPALAQVNERGAAVRRVAKLDAFKNEEAHDLLRWFDKWRLVVRTGDSVEVAHEAMFREWPRFQRWLIPEKGRLESLRAVESAAATWDSRGRKSDDVTHRSRRLKEARDLDQHDDYRIQLDRNPEARAYLASCIAAERRRTMLAAGVIAGGVVLSSVAGASGSKYLSSRTLLETADKLSVIGRSIEVIQFALAGTPTATDLSPSLGLGAENLLATNGARLPILKDLGFIDTYVVGQPINFFSGNGRYLVTRAVPRESPALTPTAFAAYAPEAMLHDLETGASRSLGPAKFFALSPRGDYAAVQAADGAVTLHLLATGETTGLGRATTENALGSSAVFSPDGGRLAFMNANNELQVRDLASGKTLSFPSVRGYAGGAWSYLAGGKLILAEQDYASTAIYDLGDGTVTRLEANRTYYGLPGPGVVLLEIDGINGQLRRGATTTPLGPVTGYSGSADGRYVVIRKADGTAALHDLTTGAVMPLGAVRDRQGVLSAPRFSGTISEKLDLAFSADGRYLLTAAPDEQATLYDLPSARPRPLGKLSYFEFSGNGRYLLTAGGDGIARLRDLDTDTETELGPSGLGLNAYYSQVTYFSPGGRFVVISNTQGEETLRDLASNDTIPLGGVGYREFSPDDKRLLVVESGSVGTLRDLTAPLRATRGAGMRSAVCRTSGDALRPFSDQARTGSHPTLSEADQREIQGRPWNPCDWRGLGAGPEGWAQWMRRMEVVTFGNTSRDYKCGETDAAGHVTQARTDLCRIAGAPEAQIAGPKPPPKPAAPAAAPKPR